jgi:hypothetical protein
MNKQFGTGAVYNLPTTNYPDSSPELLGILQEASLTGKATTKDLYGQGLLPVDSGDSNLEVSGKAKLGALSLSLLQLVLGGTRAAGVKLAVDEAAAIPDNPGPYTIVVAHAGTFDADAGVFFTDTQKRLVRVGAAPATGQYSVNAGTGTYTFAAADKKLNVTISYIYKDAANGETLTVTNRPAGSTPKCRVFLFSTRDGKIFGVDLFSVRFNEVGIATKQGDFWMTDVSFKAFCNDADQLAAFYAQE